MLFGKSLIELKTKLVENELKIKTLEISFDELIHKFNSLRGVVNRKLGNYEPTAEIEKNISVDGLDSLRDGRP